METPHRFRAHGLEFASAIDCGPAIAPSSAPPDIRVRIGAVPSNVKTTHHTMVREREVVIRAGWAADFWIAGGTEIIVTPRPDARPSDVSRLLLGAAVGAAFHQRGIVALHGGVVSRGGRGVVLIGASGSGKSTAIATLIQRGFTMLDDNIAVLAVRDDGFTVEPGVAELRLCDDTAAPEGCDGPVWYQRGRRKARVAVRPHFQLTPVPLSAIYVLTPSDVPEPLIRPLSRPEGFIAVSRHVFCRHLRSVEQERRAFPLLARLAAAVPVAELHRPLTPSDPGMVAVAVERDLRRLFPKDP